MLPAQLRRYSVTLWYYDAPERARAMRHDSSGEQASRAHAQ